ncbi:unnamed protein product [Adineta steineri]|uniref:Uncharacterized protein n=1 Tax=Adineta steineri TaxID=433720 RepID=A0A814YZV9_9BILA|nr:unnamed protein product [Adineta steineri]CAF1235421.1 unnamed protein product [Adineta steineri]
MKLSIRNIQTVAHGQYCHNRRTAQPSVVQYSMLDASCPTGNYTKISSFARLKRSTSSRYKKYRKDLAPIHPLQKPYTLIHLSNNSIQPLL